jgi:hypothetical protein
MRWSFLRRSPTRSFLAAFSTELSTVRAHIRTISSEGLYADER